MRAIQETTKRYKDSCGYHKKKGAIVIFFLIISSFSLQAQCKVLNEAFTAGEVMNYELFFNWKFIWLRAGTARLSMIDTTFALNPVYRMDLLAATGKSLDRIFKMHDTITSIVSKQLEPTYYRKGAEEGKHYSVDEAWFSQKDGMSYVHQKRLQSSGKIIETTQSDSRCIHDMLSILAHARSFHPEDFTVGQKILFPMATGRRVEEQTLIYRGIENVKAENGTTYRCLVFSLVEYEKGKKGKLKEKEVITFFVTDDKNHIPVRLDLYLNIGSAKAFLRNVSGNRYPLNAVGK
jgi:hypothetical protein